MIKNYGLFWRRDSVHWNYNGARGEDRGHLKGVKNRQREEIVVDFREQAGIYCLYDDNFRLLYVGQAGFGNATLFDRLKNHTSNDLAERWTRFSWFGLKNYSANEGVFSLQKAKFKKLDVAEVLNSLEGILIVGAEPPLNRQGPRFGDAEKFSQYFDGANVYPPLMEMVQEIHDATTDDEEE